MRKTVNQTVVIVVLLIVVMAAGIVFWRVASPKKKYFLPGVGEVTADGRATRGTGAGDGPQEGQGPGTGRRGPGGGRIRLSGEERLGRGSR